jgi:hypothetical protein
MTTKLRKLDSASFAKAASILLALLLGTSPALLSAAEPIDESRRIISQTNQQLERSQQTINKLHDATTTTLDQYKTTLRETETYTTYNRQLKEIIASQQEELSSLDTQVNEVAVTSKQIMPLMERMIETLEAFIAQDLPFLPQERGQRIARLKENMAKADLSVAEKYRKILEAYQIEIEYGKTMEAYQGEVDSRKVNFLKLGRIAFFYQTLDKSQSAVWNKHQNAWQEVADSEVKRSIEMGIKIARKQRSPELLTILASKVEAGQ